MKNASLRLTTIVALASLSIFGRLITLPLPGISLSYLALALAGIAYGARVGASVGFLGRLASDLIISGPNPIFIPMTLVEVLLGAGAGLFGRVFDVGQRTAVQGWWPRILLFNFAVVFTIAYSLLGDSLTWIFYNFLLPNAPDAARGALWTVLIVQGLIFNVPAILVNAVLFPAALPPILVALRQQGLLPTPNPGAETTTSQ